MAVERKDIGIGLAMAVAGAAIVVASGFSFQLAVDFQLSAARSFLSGSPGDMVPLLLPFLVLSLYFALYMLSFRLSLAGFSVFLLSGLAFVPSGGVPFFLVFILLSLLFRGISKPSALPLTLSILLATYLASQPMYAQFRNDMTSMFADELWSRISGMQEEIVGAMASQIAANLPEQQRQAFIDSVVSESLRGIEQQRDAIVGSVMDEAIFTPSFEKWFPVVSALTMSFLLSISSIIGDILASLVSLLIPRRTTKEGSGEEGK